MDRPFRVAIFASGSGTNAEAIIKRFQHHKQIEVALVLSNNAHAFVLERAKTFGVPGKTFNRAQFSARTADGRESEEVLNWLKEKGITHIVLAGFMWLMPASVVQAYP